MTIVQLLPGLSYRTQYWRLVLRTLIFTSVLLLLPGIASAEEPTLYEKLLDVTLEHLATNGPDLETAQFMSQARDHAWTRRQEFADLVTPHLRGKDPEKVANALAILFWLRTISDRRSLQQNHQDFFTELDQTVYDQLEHFHSLQSEAVYRSLANYLSDWGTAESRSHLLRIVKSPGAKGAKEQALICLTWRRDPRDMELLFPYILKESSAARNLPYHFRNSYGEVAIPYLKRALVEAKSQAIRQRTAYQLVHLNVPEGFQYLQQIALGNPEPEQPKWARPLEGVRQFATDYLGLPRDTNDPAAIAAHFLQKERELCPRQ